MFTEIFQPEYNRQSQSKVFRYTSLTECNTKMASSHYVAVVTMFLSGNENSVNL